MSDPHARGRVHRDHYFTKTEVKGRLFAVLDWMVDDRDMTLMPHLSRAVRRGDLLELSVTDETGRGPGDTVQRLAYLCFMEAGEAGLLLSGDTVTIDRIEIGTLIGFNETHMPNHLNVVISADERNTGKALELKLDGVVSFSGITLEAPKKIGFQPGSSRSAT